MQDIGVAGLRQGVGKSFHNRPATPIRLRARLRICPGVAPFPPLRKRQHRAGSFESRKERLRGHSYVGTPAGVEANLAI
jgi:hypothetical protein